MQPKPWPELEAALAEQIGPDLAQPEDQLLAAMRYAALNGGKRVRAQLVRLSCTLAGVEAEPCLHAAAALELMHAYSLVHDDLPCMDDADMRRGKPSVHRAFDEVTAVLAGDALQALAFQAAAQTHSLAFTQALAEAAGARGMVGGQMLDLMAEATDLEVGEADLYRLQAKKTGALIRLAASAGPLLKPSDPDRLKALQAYGQALGLAFQLVDDLLDVQGDPSQTGKPQLDSAAGKTTFLTLWGPDKTRAHAESLVQQAKAALHANLDAEAPGAQGLHHIADFILTRSH